MTHLHGCHNRRPLATRAVVQNGWYMDGTTRAPRMESIPVPKSRDCKHERRQTDPGCTACKWINGPEAELARVQTS